MADSYNLYGKVALVTGAAQGIGEHSARRLASLGASLICTDVNEAGAAGVAADICAQGGKAIAVSLDVGDEIAWQAVVAKAMETFGKVDILVNNAGKLEFELIQDMELESFDRMMRVNVRGTFLGCKYILPAMQAAGGGAIVNISSNSAMVSDMPGCAAYSASKGATRAMTKGVAIDYVPFNIRVNSVHPGLIATPIAKPFIDDPESLPIVLGRTPMKRPGEPEEVANLVAFLASDQSSFMTGSEVVIDGGFTAC
ncbi:SDR family NAD(P)-dependent oxidoreductase [Sphingobium boeckii]|uniref:NAD(P)-dependent dehydrogenase (Short-subunit alcohol dehydrogenase family) n=1 Tax=Sphingobium boeckii TaxID=1082345 RepID=A0A7W9AHN3_9SPHN|nr:glucose 1-dehydrogenase [Sphingobium boeckii]MBB5685692.1 NAD(P)-dependent dehydrogenase (short-subunit alcohol dehydrogenase family) [Sphingobium boeckii]